MIVIVGYYCNACGKDYEFKSWYDRHLTRANHRHLSAIMDNAVEKEPEDVASLEVCNDNTDNDPLFYGNDKAYDTDDDNMDMAEKTSFEICLVSQVKLNVSAQLNYIDYRRLKIQWIHPMMPMIVMILF